MASSSSSPCLSLSFPSSCLSGNWDYDVFPSFHGADVRKGFLSHVLKEFRRKGIDLFIDNEIKRGEFIGPELKQAIRGSKIAVVLFSKNYASSSWCLDELVEIMKSKESGQKVIPIFYDVDPTDIRKQTGYFGKVFKKTCRGKDKEKTETWRKSLEGVANIAGYHSSQWVDDASMIDKIAADISVVLNRSTPSRDFENFVGMEKHMERLNQLLRLDLDERRMIGIWGPPGIGKTSIVRFLFSKLSNRFQNTAFIEDIKGTYPKICFDKYEAKLQLQKKMMSRMIDQSDIVVDHLGVVEQRLRNKKVLLVLDDVDRFAQLDALAGNVEWFGPGSRIIITTEDRILLKAIGINHIYKVDFPSTDEALEMFCMYAFQKKSPEEGFDELAREITYLVGELPLGLEVMGSHFRGLCKDKARWLMEVTRLRTNLDGDIMKVLKFSYDALCDDYKDLFLHIACFFNGRDLNQMKLYVGERFTDFIQMINVLEDKSLIYLEDLDNSLVDIKMHKLLAKLGQEIFLKESVQCLNEYKDVCQILTDSKITRSVFEGELGFIYKFGHPIIISWKYCPFTCLDVTNNLEFLVELYLICSKLEKLWDGTKLLRNLKRLDLAYSDKLKELPNLSMATNLKRLDLERCSSLVKLPSFGNATNLQLLNLNGCSSLVELHYTIGNATNLRELNLQGCSSLVEIPASIGNATNLKKLNLQGCSSLVEIPASIGNATNLRELNLQGCSSLIEIPASIGNATNLRILDLQGCSSLVEIPASIGNATNLRELNLKGCSSLVVIPSSIWNATNLEKLEVGDWSCSTLVLPSSIEKATNLQRLYLDRCSKMVELPASIWNAPKLRELILSGCSNLVKLPSSIENAANLESLSLEECSSLVKLPCSIGNAASLEYLNLEGCSSLLELPSSIGNAANLSNLNLKGCSSLLELPSSIGNAANLCYLNLKGCSSLVELPPFTENAAKLWRFDLEGCSGLVELPFSIGNATNLRILDLKGCSNLVELPVSIGNAINLEELNLKGCSSLISLPQLPKSLEKLHVENCKSLEKLDCSFSKRFWLHFINCFNLNKEARDLIIQSSTYANVILPGKEVPACFTYRASGSCVTVKLNEKHLPTSTKFKACILFNESRYSGTKVSVIITSKHKNGITAYSRYINSSEVIAEHLYIFDFEAEVTSTELYFTFELEMEIKECGVLPIIGASC